MTHILINQYRFATYLYLYPSAVYAVADHSDYISFLFFSYLDYSNRFLFPSVSPPAYRWTKYIPSSRPKRCHNQAGACVPSGIVTVSNGFIVGLVINVAYYIKSITISRFRIDVCFFFCKFSKSFRQNKVIISFSCNRFNPNRSL